MMNTSRPGIVTSAMIVLLLLSLFNLSGFFQPDDIKPPLPVLIWALVAGVAGLIAAAGLWSVKPWGRLLTIVLSAVSAVSAVPGIFLAPNLAGKSVSVALIVLYGLVLVLAVLPATRQAFATDRTRFAA